MKNLNLLLIFILISRLAVIAQDKTVSGQITSDGVRIPGVNVSVLGTSIGTASNSEGFYKLRIPQEADSLIFQFIGYKTQIIKIGDKQQINIELKTENIDLKEVKIQGFATATTLARRRIENIQITPESIIAVTSEEIENAGISGIPDFISTIPNASFISSQNIGTHSLTVRGITQLRNAEAPVAIVIDGVNIPNPSGLDQEMFDIEQIELIKGPQGALYGRNAIGGVLNITTKKPTNRFSNFIKLGYANGNTYNTIFGSSGPIIKNKLLYRIAASYKNSDGLIENDFTHKKVDFYNNKSARAQLIYNITNNFSADIIANYTNTEGGATYYIIGNSDFLSALGGNNGITEPLTADNISIKPTADEPGNSNRLIEDISLRLNAAFPFGRLISTTAFSQINYDYHGDMDMSSLREFFQDQTLVSEGFSQEIRLSSNTNKKLSWVCGVNYQLAKRELKTLGKMSSAGAFTGIFELPQTDLENEVFYPIFDAQENNINTTIAFFAQTAYKLNKKIEFALGLRYDIDKREQTNLIDKSVREHTFEELQPKVNFSYKFSPRIFTFASYSKGYRSGGFNAPTIIRYPELYKAEYSNNYEIGIKTNWLNNRLIVNFSTFFIDFYNTMIYLVELDGGGQIIVNLGRTQNTGVELDMKFRITKNLDLYLSGGIINPEIIENGTSIPDSISTNFEGKYAPQINLNNTNIALQYAIPLNKQSKILIYAKHEHRGKLYWHPDNKDIQPETEFVDVKLSFTHKSKLEWKIGIFANNLLNTDYSGEYLAVEFSGAPFGDLRWPGTPRTYGLNFLMKF